MHGLRKLNTALQCLARWSTTQGAILQGNAAKHSADTISELASLSCIGSSIRGSGIATALVAILEGGVTYQCVFRFDLEGSEGSLSRRASVDEFKVETGEEKIWSKLRVAESLRSKSYHCDW